MDTVQEQAPDLAIPLLIMQQMTNDAQFTTNALAESYEASLRARDGAIANALWALDRLLASDFAPSSYAIERAIMPLRVYASLDGAS